MRACSDMLRKPWRLRRVSRITEKPMPPRTISAATVSSTSGSAAKPVRLEKPPNRSKPALQKALTAWNTANHRPAPKAVHRYESDGEQPRPRGLDAQRQQQVQPGQVAEVGQGRAVHGFPDQHPVLDRDPPPQYHHDPGGEHHEAQPAHLDQREQHHLPEQGEGRAGVHRHEARHAYRGGGREQAVEQADAVAVPARAGSASSSVPSSMTARKPNTSIPPPGARASALRPARHAHGASSCRLSCRSMR